MAWLDNKYSGHYGFTKTGRRSGEKPLHRNGANGRQHRARDPESPWKHRVVHLYYAESKAIHHNNWFIIFPQQFRA